MREIEPHDSVERYTGLGVEWCGHGADHVARGRWRSRSATAERRRPDHAEHRHRRRRAALRAADPGPGGGRLPHVRHRVGPAPAAARLVVLGGGPIGCELTQAFARFGAQVTQVEMLPRLMIREDPEVSALVQARFGPTASTCSPATRRSSSCVDGGREDHWWWSTRAAEMRIAVRRDAVRGRPRRQHAAATGSRNSASATTKARTVEVERVPADDLPEHLRLRRRRRAVTSSRTPRRTRPGTPRSTRCSAGSGRSRSTTRVIPWATFTDPEVARVGLNEQEAKEKGIPHEVATATASTTSTAPSPTARRTASSRCSPKPGTDRILGRDHRRRARRRPARRVRAGDEARHRPEQDPRHHPHLSDAGRGQQVRGRARGSARP